MASLARQLTWEISSSPPEAGTTGRPPPHLSSMLRVLGIRTQFLTFALQVLNQQVSPGPWQFFKSLKFFPGSK